MKTPSSRAAAFGIGLVLVFGGCESTGDASEPVPAVAKTSGGAKAKPGKASAAAGKAAMVTTSMAFPTGNPRSSAVQVDKLTPAQVTVGEVFPMTLRVTNLTDQGIGNVVLTEKLGENLEIVESSVKVENTLAGRVWRLGDLGPNEFKVIDLTAAAKKHERIATCLSVVYDTVLCATIPVVQPALRLVASGPAEALACDDIVYKYVATNAGTGSAENVIVRIELPEGLTDEAGRRSVTQNLGSLPSGKSVEFTLGALASRTGRFEHSARATGSNDLIATAQAVATTVTRPVLAITEDGPKSAFAGRNLSYDITVENTGDGVAQDTLIVHEIPAGLSFASATQGGHQVNGKVQWNLGDMAPGGSATVNLKLAANSIGNFINRTSARAYCTEEASATAATSVTGIPAILLEVVDLEDPVEVGQVLTYLITVTNQGTAPGTNVKITATMPAGTEFVSADGSTQAMAGAGASGTITLTPLGVLAPKAKATWQVRLRATQASDARFAVSMTSDQLSSPVTESEATNYYE